MPQRGMNHMSVANVYCETTQRLPSLRSRFAFRSYILDANCLEPDQDTQTWGVILDGQLRTMECRHGSHKGEAKPGAFDLRATFEAIEPLKDPLPFFLGHAQTVIRNACDDL